MPGGSRWLCVLLVVVLGILAECRHTHTQLPNAQQNGMHGSTEADKCASVIVWPTPTKLGTMTPPVTPDECTQIIAQWELGKLDYIERRPGLSIDQIERVKSAKIGDVVLVKRGADGAFPDPDGRLYILDEWGRFVNGYFEQSLCREGCTPSRIIYRSPLVIPHEFAHYMEWLLFPGGSFQCIGHGRVDSQCTDKDPYK